MICKKGLRSIQRSTSRTADAELRLHRRVVQFYLALGCLLILARSSLGEPWKRHTIDRSSRGADGVRLADVNGDGLLDIATGWEEGGAIRVCVNPGPDAVPSEWPSVTVGKVKSPEDAVLVDLDGDGALDVVSCCEGRTRTLFVHWAPKDKNRYLDENAWTTEPIPDSIGKTMWMFCLPLQVDGQRGIDLVVGSKAPGAVVGWYEAPENPRDLQSWQWREIAPAGWIMSLWAADMDGDGDQDVLYSDRKGKSRGIWWSEHPGGENAADARHWRRHLVGGEKHEVMFLKLADLDADGLNDVVCATRNGEILVFRRTGKSPQWEPSRIANPLGVPWGKAVAVGDVNLDRIPDIVHDANTQGNRTHPGIVWLSRNTKSTDDGWTSHDISGDAGVKFDRLELVDFDGDGDLDVLTCEERDNLGVFWCENPTR